MSAYYPQIDCVLIDADGERTAAASLTFDIYNVTTSTSEGTATSNTSGIIASASLGVSDGDILEFTHGTYPGVYRCVAKTLQSSAFSDQGNYGLTYVVENLQTPEDANQAVLIAIDTNSPDARPVTLGKALGGTTTDFLVDKSSVSRTWRIYPVSQRKDGSFSQPEYTTLTSTEYEDVTISAFTLGGLAGTQTAKTFFAGPVSGSAAAPTFRAISMSDLGTGTPSSSNFLRGDGSWQSVSSGLTIGTTAIASGTAGRVLFENSSNVLAEHSGLTYDGASHLGIGTTPDANYGLNIAGAFCGIQMIGGSAADLIFGHSASATNAKYTFIRHQSGVGTFSTLTDGYGYQVQGIIAWDALTGKVSFGLGSTAPSTAQVEMRSTTEQLRISYDGSNYFSTTVGSSGGVTFDAVGSGAKFTFSDSIEVADAKDIIVGTSTGTKIGTSTSQKLGFFNATPVTQRADIGALTDSTTGAAGGTLGSVSSTVAAGDGETINDNFASVLDKINGIRVVLRDLGFMA